VPHENSSPPSAARPLRPADRRDEIVAAALVGMVVVLLGYASGIGGSGGTATASGVPTPGAVVQPTTAPTSPAPVIVSATGIPSGNPTSDPGYYLYSNTVPTGNPTNPTAGPTSAPAPPTGIPSAANTGGTTVVVGSPSSGATPRASASASTSAATGALDCALGSNGLTSVLPTATASDDPLGNTVSGVTTTLESLLGGVLGTCTATAAPTATPTPSASGS